nr:hypothetical protein [Desulfobacula sp.]
MYNIMQNIQPKFMCKTFRLRWVGLVADSFLSEYREWVLSVLVFVIVFTTLAGESVAIRMPGNSPSIILSKGMTIQCIEDPLNPPRTFRDIEDIKFTVPVASGKILFRFEDLYLNESETRQRQLVLTEDGIWGYAPVNIESGERKTVFEAESRLRDVYESKETFMILLDDYTAFLDQLTVPIKFTRGEIYKVQSDPEGKETTVSLSEDKLADIGKMNPGVLKKNLPQTVTIPSNVLIKINVCRVLPNNVSFSKKYQRRDTDYSLIYNAWAKAIPEKSLSTTKMCGASIVTVGTGTNRANFAIGGDLGGGATLWKQFKAAASIGGELEKKSEKVITEVLTQSEGMEFIVTAWSIENMGSDQIFFTVKNKKCDDGARWSSLRSESLGCIDFNMHSMKDLCNECFENRTGIIYLKNYTDYLKIIPELSRSFDITEQQAIFMLSKIGRVQDRSTFFP